MTIKRPLKLPVEQWAHTLVRSTTMHLLTSNHYGLSMDAASKKLSTMEHDDMVEFLQTNEHLME